MTDLTQVDKEITYSEKIRKRALYEDMKLSVTDDGHVLVENQSYGEDAPNHTYLVVVSDLGIPQWCMRVTEDGMEDCPAKKWHCDNERGDDEPVDACKHMARVAFEPPRIEEALEEKKKVKA